MVDKVMFSSATDEWSTPQEFYDNLNAIHHFNLDPCATALNAKCENYYTKEDDGLVQDWCLVKGFRTPAEEVIRGRVFVNPPYGQPENPCKPNCEKKKCLKRGWHTTEYIPGVIDWVKKAIEEIKNHNAELVVMLLPARTCSRWFHQYVYDDADEIYFIKGRLTFGGAKHCAPFPSMVVVYSHTEEWL